MATPTATPIPETTQPPVTQTAQAQPAPIPFWIAAANLSATTFFQVMGVLIAFSVWLGFVHARRWAWGKATDLHQTVKMVRLQKGPVQTGTPIEDSARNSNGRTLQTFAPDLKQ